MSKKITSKDVVTISGSIWNDSTRAVANAVNYNAQILKNVLDRIAELEKQLSSAQGWTPVSEGFPEADDRYQVTFESGEVGHADFRNRVPLLNGSIKENVWETERYYEDDGEVIAWMPVPEPYKR